MTSSQIVINSGYGLVAALHAIGLILLYKAKERHLPNQRLVTINLALTEMLLGLWLLIRNICQVSSFSISLVFFFDIFLYTNIRFVIWHITVDRFLCIWLNLKYPVYITKKVLVIIIIVHWLLSIIMGTTFTLLLELNILSPSAYTALLLVYIFSSFDMSIAVTAIAAFLYFFIKIRSIYKRSPKHQRRYKVMNVWLKLKIPSLMVVTYIVFNLSSNMMKLALILYRFDNLYTPAIILDICGWLSDVIIYIILQRGVRFFLKRRMKRELKLHFFAGPGCIENCQRGALTTT